MQLNPYNPTFTAVIRYWGAVLVFNSARPPTALWTKRQGFVNFDLDSVSAILLQCKYMAVQLNAYTLIQISTAI